MKQFFPFPRPARTWESHIWRILKSFLKNVPSCLGIFITIKRFFLMKKLIKWFWEKENTRHTVSWNIRQVCCSKLSGERRVLVAGYRGHVSRVTQWPVMVPEAVVDSDPEIVTLSLRITPRTTLTIACWGIVHDTNKLICTYTVNVCPLISFCCLVN